jgi:hypothetical protein
MDTVDALSKMASILQLKKDAGYGDVRFGVRRSYEIGRRSIPSQLLVEGK